MYDDFGPPFHSKVHGQDICLREFSDWSDDHIHRVGVGFYKVDDVMKPFVQTIIKIAHGFDFWNYDCDEAQKIRIPVLRRMIALPSNGHAFERANKLQNFAASNNRKEKNVSTRLMASSQLRELSR